jgi:hypothetical protein
VKPRLSPRVHITRLVDRLIWNAHIVSLTIVTHSHHSVILPVDLPRVVLCRDLLGLLTPKTMNDCSRIDFLAQQKLETHSADMG